MSRVCPSKFKISSSPIKEMSKERKDAMDAVSWGTLWKFVQTNPHPRQKKKARKDKALTSIRSWDNSSSEEEHHHKRRGHKHSSSSSSRVCLMARGNKSSSSSESDSDDEMPCLNELVQENIKYAKA